tara:strand:+ start:133 stop:942 length:810 start_codon:yes stop_codon:yes gene_type:complete
MKTTEKDSFYNNLEKMSISNILKNINTEDKKVGLIVEDSIPKISYLSELVFKKLKFGGRLFYIGSGTSGRLGILDASECPPTFGVKNNLVIGLIAGGDKAIQTAVEFAEDCTKSAWEDLNKHNISKKDIVIGISASGTTPYVLGGLKKCIENNITTGLITCNSNKSLHQKVNCCIELIVGPEFITGSTRMKAGTAQKMTLNMITTSVMIKLGHVIDNKMVDMKLTNSKLKIRGKNMIIDKFNITEKEAESLLKKYKNVRKVMDKLSKNE